MTVGCVRRVRRFMPDPSPLCASVVSQSNVRFSCPFVFFVSLSFLAALFRRVVSSLVCLCVTLLRRSFRVLIADLPDGVARSDAAWVVAASCVAAAVWTWGAGALDGDRARRPLRSFQTYPLRSFISVCTVIFCLHSCALMLRARARCDRCVCVCI